MRALLVILICVRWLAGELRAEPLIDETFPYPDGLLVGAPASAWITHSGVAGQVEVAGGRALLIHTNTEDVSLVLPGGPYAPTTNVELYAGLVLQLRKLPSAAGDYLAHFKSTGSSGYAGRLFVGIDDAAPGKYRLGLSRTANTAAYLPVDLDLYTDYSVVLRYRVADGGADLWLEPQAGFTPDLTATDPPSGAGVIAGFALRQSSGIGYVEIDSLRAGTALADALPGSDRLQPAVITEPPAGRIATEGDTVTLSAGAAGSDPLHYQWLFGGANLPGATAALLTLETIQRSQAGEYSLLISNRAGFQISAPAAVAVNALPRPAETLTVLSYNLKGNGAADWSTNSPQVRAIGRQMEYLQPDILALTEVPNNQWWEMTNFIQVWLPGYFLAGNSGTDGYVRSAVLSRWPVVFSRSWLDGVSLAPFGATNRFARDLFHAQVTVPFFPQPLNVFVTHLKATTSQPPNDALRRGAEAAAISNFLVTVWLPTNSLQPYVLCGDLNEDILRPDTNRYTSHLPIQTLTATSTGLQLTTPVNPQTTNDFTISIQTKLTARFDYILPCALLWSNLAGGQVFRTDLAPGLPPPLLPGDSATASDHLPVLLTFDNPYAHAFRLLACQPSGGRAILSWEAVPGNQYRIEGSPDLTNWLVLQSDFSATNFTATLDVAAPEPLGFFRVYRQPPDAL